MGPINLLIHLLNFLAPALSVAVLVALCAPIFMKNKPVAFAVWAQIAINFIVSAVTLVLGLWFFGRDGKMTTYAGMTLLCATSQWIMLRGWRA